MSPTKASFVDTIERGSFGPIVIGTSRQSVGQTLGEPSDATITNRSRTSCIWRYGAIEFHFDDDLLTLIHCDADDLFDGGQTLIVDPWKLRGKMPLLELTSILDAKKIYYTGCNDQYASECSIKFDSGCALGFVLDPNAGFGPSGLCSWSVNK